ncbi:GntR family transcriptional regulator [Fodinicola acaciae]|uniref:GntR family transcriptional regulator n=1 Tax=Fodinicola acaciae TaxID=2681555 RepID=UPI001FEC5112|nr:GntR family transcriptional regulator [Fodinicola acaciae]
MYEMPVIKYVQVLQAIQRRIVDGTYPPGSMLPTEVELRKEFNVSRPTVVKAVSILMQDGWIRGHQGKGRIIIGDPAKTRSEVPEHVADLLNGDETSNVNLLRVGFVAASNRIAYALEVESGSPVLQRQRLAVSDELGPTELISVYVPVQLTTDTQLVKQEPVDGGVLRHLMRERNVEPNYAHEVISCRPATKDESEILKLTTKEWVLTTLLTVCDLAGDPIMVVDVAMPSTRQEIQGRFNLEGALLDTSR